MGENNYISETIYNKDEPLDRNTYIQMQDYADQKQDSRFDELLKSVDKILFWTRIIGIYYLITMIIIVVTIILNIILDIKLFELLYNLLKNIPQY